MSTYLLYTAGGACLPIRYIQRVGRVYLFMSSNFGNFACANIRRPFLLDIFLYCLKIVSRNSNFGMFINMVSIDYMSNFATIESFLNVSAHSGVIAGSANSGN